MKEVVFLISAVLIGFAANAQIGRVGINTIAPQAMLHVKDSSVLFTGAATLPGTPGNPPVSGAGTRMMWYADKAAFRVGNVSNQNWDNANIGNYSFATGRNSMASASYSAALGINTVASGVTAISIGSATVAAGNNSIAMGVNANASGYSAIAMGNNTISSGDYSTTNGIQTKATAYAAVAMGDGTMASNGVSTAIGSYTTAAGYASTAMGAFTRATGFFSTATGYETVAAGELSATIGFHTYAKSYASLSIGQYNDSVTASSKDSWVEADPVFIIGNGTAHNSRSNALTILKNAKTGINTAAPEYGLHVVNSNNNDGGFADGIMIQNTAPRWQHRRGSSFIQE